MYLNIDESWQDYIIPIYRINTDDYTISTRIHNYITTRSGESFIYRKYFSY
jgi:hypothetical protein